MVIFRIGNGHSKPEPSTAMTTVMLTQWLVIFPLSLLNMPPHFALPFTCHLVAFQIDTFRGHMYTWVHCWLCLCRAQAFNHNNSETKFVLPDNLALGSIRISVHVEEVLRISLGMQTHTFASFTFCMVTTVTLSLLVSQHRCIYTARSVSLAQFGRVAT